MYRLPFLIARMLEAAQIPAVQQYVTIYPLASTPQKPYHPYRNYFENNIIIYNGLNSCIFINMDDLCSTGSCPYLNAPACSIQKFVITPCINILE
jgi:hypothetical protein